ncbi:MAG TPA: EamA family transporter RarD [Thermohalobaculum sp.]|nr:EamA family transporter RarD [Thermohalobaculum sp.]
MAGFFAALTASVIWGFSPAFFSLLNAVPRDELLAHRIAWACVFVLAYCVATGRIGRVRAALGDRRLMRPLMLSATFMTVNWFIFLLAVGAGRVFESGIGYYMMPLMSVGLGVALLGERLNRRQWLAVALAAVAVAVLSFGVGVAPWLALALGGTFASYGFIRKRTDVGSIVGFQVEILLVTPAALIWLAGVHWLGWHGIGGGVPALFGADGFISLMLVASGIMTGLPLILFAEATRRMEYSTVGLMQYVNPSIQVATAGVLLGEHFSRWHWWALALIWCALAIYGRELLRQGRERRRVAAP